MQLAFLLRSRLAGTLASLTRCSLCRATCAGQVSRLQDSIRTAQKTNAETITSVQNVLREVRAAQGQRRRDWAVVAGREIRRWLLLRREFVQGRFLCLASRISPGLAQVFMRTIFSRWRTFSMARQNRKRICSHVTEPRAAFCEGLAR